MHIGHNRPLFCFCALWMLASGAGYALARTGWLLWVAMICGSLCLCIMVAAVARRCFRKRPWGKQSRLLVAGMAVLIAGLSCYNAGTYFERQITPESFPGIPVEATETAETSEDEDIADLPEAEGAPVWEVRAVVAERLSGGSQITGYGLILEAVGETELSSTLRPARAYLLCSYASDLQPGYEITLRAKAVTLTEAAGDLAASLHGDGYSLGLLSGQETDCHVDALETTRLSVRLGNLRRQLAARLEAAVGDEGQGLPSALLLGDRSQLSPALRRDFSRAGVSHLLAISGLHMTLLFGMLALLLQRLPLTRRVRAILLGSCALGYLFLLGFPPSATRSVVMLGMLYLSWVCSASADSLTSLGLAGALILGVSPCTLMDAGFWMSFSATLGLLTASAAVSSNTAQPRFRLWRRVKSTLSGLFTGLVAMTFSLWITSMAIGTVSLWSPLATLLLTPLCGLVLAVSLLLLPLTGQWVGSHLLAPILRAVSGWMGELASWMAQPTGAVISLRQPYTGIAITTVIALMTLCLLVWLFCKLPRKARLWGLAPVAVGWVALLLLAELPARLAPQTVLTSYLHETTASEAILLVRGHEAVICDLGDGSRTSLNKAVTEADTLGATEISALVLTHYHTRMPGSLWRILSTEMVRTLWLPLPTTEDDYYRMLSCLQTAERLEVPVRLYEPGNSLDAFDGGLQMTLYTDTIARSAQPVLLLHIAGQTGSSLTFVGSSVYESGLAQTADHLVADSRLVIYGAHGPLIKQAYAAVPSATTQQLVFADEKTAAYLDPDSLPDRDIPALRIGSVRGVLSGREPQ